MKEKNKIFNTIKKDIKDELLDCFASIEHTLDEIIEDYKKDINNEFGAISIYLKAEYRDGLHNFLFMSDLYRCFLRDCLNYNSPLSSSYIDNRLSQLYKDVKKEPDCYLLIDEEIKKIINELKGY